MTVVTAHVALRNGDFFTHMIHAFIALPIKTIGMRWRCISDDTCLEMTEFAEKLENENKADFGVCISHCHYGGGRIFSSLISTTSAIFSTINPTIMDFIGTDTPADVDGCSLIQECLSGTPVARPYLHGEHSADFEQSNQWIRMKNYKYIWQVPAMASAGNISCWMIVPV